MGLQTILSSLTWSDMANFYLYFLLGLAAANSPVVDLGYTSYEGQSLAGGVSQWLGMRYAAPPVNDLRFAAPQDPLSQKGVQQATQVCIEILPITASHSCSLLILCSAWPYLYSRRQQSQHGCARWYLRRLPIPRYLRPHGRCPGKQEITSVLLHSRWGLCVSVKPGL